MVAPSLVMVTSPTLSTSILSRLYVSMAAESTQLAATHPTGPSDDLRMFDTDCADMTIR